MSTPEERASLLGISPAQLAAGREMPMPEGVGSEEEREGGFIDYITRISKGFLAADYVLIGGGDPNSAPSFFREEAQAVQESVPNRRNLELADFVFAFGRHFTPEANQRRMMEMVSEDPVAEADQAKMGFSDFIPAMATELVRPIGDVVELASGLNVTEGEISPLSPEQASRRINNTAAFTISVMAGLGARHVATRGARATTRALQSERAAVSAGLPINLTTGTSRQVAARGGRGALAERTKAATAEMVAGGVTYDVVRSTHEDINIGEAFTYGLMFAPLAIGLEVLGIRGTRRRLAQENRLAHEIMATRMAQVNTGHHNLAYSASLLHNLQNADNVLDAVIRTRGNDGQVSLVRGVSENRFMEVTNDMPENLDYNVRTTKNEAGETVKDILIFPRELSDQMDFDFFSRTGRVRGEYVSVDGGDYTILGYKNGLFQVESSGGHLTEVAPRRVRSHPDPFKGMRVEPSLLRAQTRMAWESRELGVALNDTPIAKQNRTTFTNTVSDEPVTLYGFNKNFVPTDYYDLMPGTHQFGAASGTTAASVPVVHQLTFNRPLVVNGRRGQLVEMLRKTPSLPESITDRDVLRLQKLLDDIETSERLVNVATDNPDFAHVIEARRHSLNKNLKQFDAAVTSLFQEYNARSDGMGYDGIIFKAADQEQAGFLNIAGNRVSEARTTIKQIGVVEFGGKNFVDNLYESHRRSILDQYANKFETVVTTAGGRPKVVFHGTSAVYEHFDPTFARSGLKGPGFYFTESPHIASGYAGGPEMGELHRLEDRLDNLYAELEGTIDVARRAEIDNEITDVSNQFRDYFERVISLHTPFNPSDASAFPPNVRPSKVALRNPFDETKTYTSEEAYTVYKQIHQSRNPDVDLTSYRGNPFEGTNDVTGEDIYIALSQEFSGDLDTVNKLLKSAGYDGITHLGGGLVGDRPHRVWIAFDAEQIRPAFASDILDIELPENFSFVDNFNEFLEAKGIDPQYRGPLMREWTKRLQSEVLSTLEEPERKAYERMLKDVNEKLALETEVSARSLTRKAISNGMYFEVEDATHLVIRDRQTGNEIHRTDSYADAIKFIDDSGQANGVDLDGGSAIPPGFGGDGIDPFDFDPRDPRLVGEENWLEKVRDAVGGMKPWATVNRNLFINFDNQYGTTLFNDVFDRTQRGRKISNAKQQPHIERLQKIYNKYAAGMNSQELELVSGYMETMSPAEIKAQVTQTRGLTDLEDSLGKRIAESDGDITKAFEYRRFREGLAKDQANGKLTPEEGIQQLADYQEARGIDNATLQIVDMFDSLKGVRRDKASIGNIVRYARAIKNNELSRPEFARKHKLSGRQIALAKELEQMFGELASEFGIPRERMLTNFMTHARLYTDGNMAHAVNMFGADAQARDFWASLARTGEIDVYETNPVRALQRYIKGGFDSQHFHQDLADAKNSLVQQLRRLKEEGVSDAEIENIRRKGESYLADIQGLPDASVGAVQGMVNRMFSKLGLDIHVDVRKNIVNAISAIGESAAQGMRLGAGMRDFGFGVNNYYTQFGSIRTARMLKLAATGLEGEGRRQLLASGKIPGITPVTFADPTELGTSMLREGAGRIARGTQKATGAMFKMSGQQDIYTLLHTGIYLEQFERAGKALEKFRKGEWSIERVAKDLRLRGFERPVAEGFLDRVAREADQEAAEFLAQQAGYESIGMYGLGNNPNGWQRNIGRVAGQFGMWPMWFISQAGRQASRGTYGEILGRSLRFATAWGGLSVAANELGFDVRNWTPWGAFAYAGGAAVSTVKTVSDAMFGYGYQQEQAQQRLKRYVPYDGEQFNVGQIYIPGSYFARDLVEAFDLAERGFNPVAVGGRAIGVHVYDDERTVIDDMIGNTPNISPQRQQRPRED